MVNNTFIFVFAISRKYFKYYKPSLNDNTNIKYYFEICLNNLLNEFKN